MGARQFYNKEEAAKYATNSRMREIQTSLTERALELLSLPNEDCFVLDVGCGSGLSGDCLTESGHQWIGCDISNDMLLVAKEQDVEGDVVLNDMGQVSLSLSFARTHAHIGQSQTVWFVCGCHVRVCTRGRVCMYVLFVLQGMLLLCCCGVCNQLVPVRHMYCTAALCM